MLKVVDILSSQSDLVLLQYCGRPQELTPLGHNFLCALHLDVHSHSVAVCLVLL